MVRGLAQPHFSTLHEVTSLRTDKNNPVVAVMQNEDGVGITIGANL